jgi:hypothetical protein
VNEEAVDNHWRRESRDSDRGRRNHHEIHDQVNEHAVHRPVHERANEQRAPAQPGDIRHQNHTGRHQHVDGNADCGRGRATLEGGPTEEPGSNALEDPDRRDTPDSPDQHGIESVQESDGERTDEKDLYRSMRFHGRSLRRPLGRIKGHLAHAGYGHSGNTYRTYRTLRTTEPFESIEPPTLSNLSILR